MNCVLDRLDLSGTMTVPNLEAAGARILSGSLRMPNPIRALHSMGQGPEGDNFRLSYLNLAYNRIDDATAKLLSEDLGANTSVRQLILRGNFIGPDGGVALAETLGKGRNGGPKSDLSRHLRKLDMSE